MMNTTIFAQVPPNFQFLSVCHCINIFGILFYNKRLITLEERNHSVSVLNTLFGYLHYSKNQSRTKLQLLQKALKGSDLYGGGENETLDMKYVNETYQYIISNALFSHYGNINGYLAKIINQADNANYFALKETVFQHLSKNYTSTNFCSPGNKSIKLTRVAAIKVFLEHIWPMFPEPEQDMSIIDVNYIYAMAGLKIIRSLGDETSKCSFQDCILISRELDFVEDNGNEIYQMVVKSYSTPALFFFAYKEKKAFQENYQTFQSNDDFWIKIYENLFSYINLTMNQIVKDTFSNNLYWKLEREMENLKNRTVLATEFLVKFCYYSNYEAERYVAIYKTFNFLRDSVPPGDCGIIPDLEEEYEAQFTNVGKLFNDIQKNLIEKALVDGNLIDILNSNTTVENGQVENYPSDGYNPPRPRRINKDIYLLFAVNQERKSNFYALRLENNSLTLVKHSGDEPKFGKIVANETSIELKTPLIYKPLKNRNEDHKVFVQRIADRKTSLFVKNLKTEYRDPTTGEAIFDFLTTLIPFYNCIQSVKSNDKPGAALSCSIDILGLIPAFSFVGKYSAKLASSLGRGLGEEYLTMGILAETVRANGINSLLQMSKAFSRTVANEILTKSFLKDLSVTTFRLLDPGFELLFRLNRLGFEVCQKTYQKLYHLLSTTNENSKLLKTLAYLLNNQKMSTKLAADHTGLVPKVLYRKKNYNVIRYTYPGGEHYVGPTCVSSFGKTAELRSISGESFQVPVVPEKSPDTMFYRPYNPKTGENFDLKFQIGENGILQPYNPDHAVRTEQKTTKFMQFIPSDESKKRIRILGSLLGLDPKAWNDVKYRKDFIVYHLTEELKNPPVNSNPVHINELAEGINLPSPVLPEAPRTSGASLPSDNIPGTSRGLQRSSKPDVDFIAILGHETYDRYLNALKEFKEKGISGIKDGKGTLRTLRNTAETISVYQTMIVTYTLPTDLWLVQTLKERSIVDILEKLEGQEFYFNDINLLTDIEPSAIIQSKRPQTVLKTEVRYHIKCDSKYGFVNLALFHDSFKNQFLVFPERKFDVVKTEVFNKREFLVLELKPKQMEKEEWLQIRKREETLLDYRERIQSRRAEKIEEAAIEKSLNTPLHTFSKSEELLKKYILKIDDTVSDVPTYHMLAQDTFAGNSVPIKYDEFQITNNIFIDDVLYQNELYNVNNLRSAEETISEIFGDTHKQQVKPLFEEYRNSPTIRDNVRFEDYFVFDSFHKGTFEDLKYNKARLLASTYRLALRQSIEFTKNRITLYLLDYHYPQMVSWKVGTKFLFGNLDFFWTNEDHALKNILHESPEKLVLYQIEVNNRVGIADVGRFYGDPNSQFLFGDLVLVKDSTTVKTINNKEVTILICHDLEEEKERRMVRLANKLNQMLSINIKYYVNEIESVPPKLTKNLDTRTRTELKVLKNSDYKTIFGELKHETISKSLSKFKVLGLSDMKHEGALQLIRRNLERLNVYQSGESLYKLPIDLWYTKTENQVHVDFLMNLQGKDFYFNDITMLTDSPGPKLASTEDKTTVRYHLQFDSQCGLIDLASFDEELKKQYMVFPEVEFYVKDVKVVKEERILDLQLVKKPIAPQDWTKIRQLEWNVLQSRKNFHLSKRGKIIENVALEISLNNPLYRFRESENLLKKYVLNIDDSRIKVPTYDTLANDINKGLKIPTIEEKYNKWKITNNMFIDDVLFQNKLYQVNNLDLATRRINKIFNCGDCQMINPVFEMYSKSKEIQNYLTFEDHYVIHSILMNPLIQGIHASRRFQASLHRLALKQSGEEWIKKPIDVYGWKVVSADELNVIKGRLRDKVIFHNKNPFFTVNEFSTKFSTFSKDHSNKKIIIYQLNINNQVGTVDIGRVYENRHEHFVLEAVQFKEDAWSEVEFHGRKYDVLILRDIKILKERRMIKMVNMLNELFSTDTKFYVTDEDLFSE